nr:hypothetical protein CFP56_61548 [Quercus suber]
MNMRPSSRKRGRSSASRTKGTRLHGAQNLLDLLLDPGKPDEAGAPRLPDRPQGLWPHGPRRPNQDQERDRVRIVGLDDHAAAAHVRDQGLGGGYDELLQPVQEHRAVAEEEEPAGDERERGFAE